MSTSRDGLELSINYNVTKSAILEPLHTTLLSFYHLTWATFEKPVFHFGHHASFPQKPAFFMKQSIWDLELGYSYHDLESYNCYTKFLVVLRNPIKELVAFSEPTLYSTVPWD